MDKQTKTILLVGAGAVALYFLTRPRTATYPPGTTLPPAGYQPALGYQQPQYNPYGQYTQQPNQTAAILTAGAGAVRTISDIFQNWFSGSGSADSDPNAAAATFYSI